MVWPWRIPVTDAWPTVDPAHSDNSNAFIASSAADTPPTMSPIPDAVSRARLAAYAAEATLQRQREARQDLASRVHYICNDLELILGELNSPAFAALNPKQHQSLLRSRDALDVAMHQLRTTTESKGQAFTNESKSTD